jgi:O-antigen/teichoic acid export membrane protein
LEANRQTGSRKLIFNFILLSGGEGLSKVFGFVAFAHLARIFGPDLYGDIEFAIALTLFFNLLVEGGLGLLGAREIAKNQQVATQMAFHIVLMRCLLAVFSFMGLLAFAYLSNKSALERQIVVLYGLTLFGSAGLLQWVFQGLDKMKWVAIGTVMRWSTFAAGVILFIQDPRLVWLVPLVETGAILLVVCFHFSVFCHLFGRLKRTFDFQFARNLFLQALPIGLTQMMWGMKIYLPTIMLGLLVGGEEVGWFGASHRIVVALHTFAWMYFFNLYPSISRCAKEGFASLNSLTGRSLEVTSWSAIFIGAFGTVAAEPLINFIYGPQYDESIWVFRVLVWLLAFALISGHYMYILIAYNKQWLELVSATSGAVAGMVLNVVLITRFGFIGAAWAVLCSEGIVWGLNFFFVKRSITHVPFLRHMVKPLVAGSIMAGALQFVAISSLWMLCCAAVTLYTVMILILQPKVITDVRSLIFGSR